MSALEPATPAAAAPTTDAPVLLEARGLTRRFGGLVACRDVDLRIPTGGIVSIIGPNGAGKTTFFNVVAGIIDPSGGSVDFRGRTLISRQRRTWLEPVFWVLPALIVLVVESLLGVFGGDEASTSIGWIIVVAVLATTLLLAIVRPAWYARFVERFGILRSARPNDVVAAGIGRTFQNIRLFQNMTALENVLVGMHLKLRSNLGDHLISSPRQRRDEAAAVVKARQLLELVGLSGIEDELAKNLPYGDQRRLELARALANDPVLVLLDEPTAGMNPHETAEMTALIGRLRSDLGLSILLIEHDMRVVMGISDHIIVLDHGERIAEGSPDEVRRNERVIEAYLGTGAS
jgi:ABC-type branched-subunit amino acid transport system ATPase component